MLTRHGVSTINSQCRRLPGVTRRQSRELLEHFLVFFSARPSRYQDALKRSRAGAYCSQPPVVFTQQQDRSIPR